MTINQSQRRRLKNFIQSLPRSPLGHIELRNFIRATTLVMRSMSLVLWNVVVSYRVYMDKPAFDNTLACRPASTRRGLGTRLYGSVREHGRVASVTLIRHTYVDYFERS